MARSFSKKGFGNNFSLLPRNGRNTQKHNASVIFNIYEISDFSNPEIPLKLLQPLKFDIILDHQLYIVKNALFDIFSFNEDLEEAKKDIELQILDLWEDFVSVDIEILAPSGIAFRNLLKNYLADEYAL
ncbi:hypothetical protein MmiEs2_09870 [Methanimicrococcus stummii]|uniref:Uncharacterized protein n=1 Tax=Methanimicrococcus stummii TaxID=3028294 RepID=A0AA96V9Q8_9EURY|nr:hypothetical protein MmiEs2_09870 [Methanimicrococcus sp. Es2]